MKKTLKNKKGITLIALVVTIVILLILAGITINAVMGEGGLINRAKTAQEKTEEGKAKDINAINNLANQVEEIINSIGNGNGNTPQDPLVEYKQSSMLTKQTNTVITLGSYEVTIPAGYMVTADSGSTVEAGIVITDAASDGNEWVWVPVSNSELATMRVNAEKTLNGVATTTNYYTNTIIVGQTRTFPGDTTGPREPDVLSDSSYDGNAANRITAGFYTVNGTNNVADTLDQMAAKMVEEYENMLNSIRTNKGFYIGRYELGQVSSTDTTAVVKRNKDVKTNTNWYQLYLDCKSLAKSSNVTTRMIYGLQWDATCNWLATNNFSITNSRSWGNYNDYNGPINGVETNAGTIQNTGASPYWSACNIYDFAGNCHEWTQEANNTNYRVYRGGVAGNAGYDQPASFRGNYNPTFYFSSNIRYSSHFNN